MEKEDVISQLEEILPIMQRLEKHTDTLSHIEDYIAKMNVRLKQKNSLTIVSFALYFGIGIIAGAGIGGSIYNLLHWNILLILPLVLAAVGAKLNADIAAKVMQKLRQPEQDRIEKEKADWEKKYKAAEQAMIDDIGPHWDKVLSIIPKEYATPMCVNNIYSYLVNQRADSLKEAINLFETEQHRWRLEESQRQMYETYQQEMQTMKAAQARLEQELASVRHEAECAYSMASSSH